jgi:hypothetical protein
MLQQRRLADAGFTFDEYEGARPRGGALALHVQAG